MNTWIELINGLMRSEIQQLEILCQHLIESLPLVIVCVFMLIFGVISLLAARDCIFLEEKDLPQFKNSETRERRPESSRGHLLEPVTSFLRSDANAAA